MKARPNAEHRRHEGRPPACPLSAGGLTLRFRAGCQPQLSSMENSVGCGQPFPLCPSCSSKGRKGATRRHLTSLGQPAVFTFPARSFPGQGGSLGPWNVGPCWLPEVNRTATPCLCSRKAGHTPELSPRLFLRASCVKYSCQTKKGHSGQDTGKPGEGARRSLRRSRCNVIATITLSYTRSIITHGAQRKPWTNFRSLGSLASSSNSDLHESLAL